MTPEERRIKIAETLGCKDHDLYDLNDLDAVLEFETVLAAKRILKYNRKLKELVALRKTGGDKK